uniref:HAUS augmin-like complex subunit 4 n=1 Tax=Heterorhabditis bacteriophora TaxID=37862 RepID=A0A1I7WS35_HETBA
MVLSEIYIPPKPSHEVEEWLCEDKPLMEEELRKQNYLLANLHQQISVLRDADCNASTLEGQVWRVQTAITALKRRLKVITLSVLNMMFQRDEFLLTMATVAEPTLSLYNSLSNSVPCCEMYEEKQLMAVHCMLRQDIINEKRRIARLCWKLTYEKHTKEVDYEDGMEPTNDWEKSCCLAEVTRRYLINEISKLRTECAVLRAKIEMYSQGKLCSTQF